MPSQIKVDEIKNVAGQYKIKTDTFEGQTTAGVINITLENSNTQKLQAGLAKMYAEVETESSNNLSSDSLNNSSFTDTATGRSAFSFTNSMNTADFIGLSNCGVSSTNDNYNSAAIIDDYNQSRSASVFHTSSADASNNLRDFKTLIVTALGDLA